MRRRRLDAPRQLFNDSANQQGTGTTIVRITPDGGQSLFFQGSSPSGQLGLTTALGVLKRGFVIVGGVPATYDSQGNLVSVGQGSLMILDRNGNSRRSVWAGKNSSLCFFRWCPRLIERTP